jgi:2-polyprenyl-3-methyl-5-hydroxy-6-metoxy-1,4-benzoquinol methylase
MCLKTIHYKFGKSMSDEFIKTKLNWDGIFYEKTGKKLAKISKIIQKTCYVCSNNNSKIISNFFGINYRRCKVCDHVFAERRLSEQQLTKFYSENKTYMTNPYSQKKLINVRKNIFSPKIDFIKQFTSGKKWLDVGSGDGIAPYVTKKNGFDVKGLELSNVSRLFARKHLKINLINKTLLDFSYENHDKFDIISFFGVLEHIPDPARELKLSNKLLKKNGLVAFSVPHYNSVSSYTQILTQNPDRHLLPYLHIMLFTLNSAKYLLKKSGFRPIAVWFWGMDMIEILKYFNSCDKKFANSILKNILVKNLNSFQQILDQSQLSDEFLIIGKKIK